MEKNITVNGQKILLKTNGTIPLVYKREFQRDFFFDVVNLQKDGLDTEILYNLLWTYAKIGNEDIPSLLEWLSEFETFPILDFRAEVIELTTACISTTKKVKTSKKVQATVE